MEWGVSVEELVYLPHSSSVFSLVAQDMGFRKVEKLSHALFTFCGIVGRGRTLHTALLCPARIFLVREHMTNVDAA